MTPLKGLGTAVLSLLLFLSLVVFGIAFTLNSTLLNPDFVVAQVDEIDVSDLAREFAEEEIVDQVPDEVDFLVDVIYDVIDEEEPWIKEQADDAIYAAYDFILGKTDALNIYIPLDIKKEDLRETLWNAFVERIPQWLPDLVESELVSYLSRYIDYFASDIPKQYLPPEIADAPADQLSEYLNRYLREIAGMVAEDHVPEVTGLLESVVRPYFDEYYDDIMDQLPSALEVNRGNIDDDVWDDLVLARKWVGYYRIGYYLLIAFMVLLVIGIFLVNRNVRDSTLSLGIILLTYGILEFAGVFVARHFLPTDLSFAFPDTLSIPVSLQTWLSVFYVDLLAPLQLLSIIVMVIGATSLVFSIFYRRNGSVPATDSGSDE